MKNKLLNYLLVISKYLERLYNKFSEQNYSYEGYSSLSPIDYGDDKGHYTRALEWALKNRVEADIKNIAITGPYGSGKSTILKTFQKNYQGDDLKFLNISLMTFRDEKPRLENEGRPAEKNKEDQLRLIETSILQQIFYHEEDRNIPDSRFKKIKSYSRKKLILISLGILIFLLSLLNYSFPYFIQSTFTEKPLSGFICDLLDFGSIIIIFVGIFFIIYKSIRIISSLTINKLKFQNAEIGIGQKLKKSILNHHLDEILYFFSIRPYNVVIIEDLDRFQETEIFTKLREINHILNNSKKTNKKGIVFIYAVRDDMFSDNERIKFFDFIIPVIPVINSSNSGEILLAKKAKLNYDLTDTFIEDISYFIDDMRLLHNITNEFHLYKLKLGETPLNQDKLFAIITYKNIYPNDFVALSKNEGELHRILNAKSIYISEEIKNIEKEISALTIRMENLDSIYINNVKELRQLYIIKIIDSLGDFKSFVVNDIDISIKDLTKDENFAYLRKDELQYKYPLYKSSYPPRLEYPIKKVPIEFSKTEKLVSSEKSYIEREQNLMDLKSSKTNLWRQQLKELEQNKVNARNLKISELIKTNQKIDLKVGEVLNEDFITILLRNGYIAEDYLDYISLFHEGSITRNDHKFIISIRNRQKLDFDYKLTKIEKVIQKINPIDFMTDFILNYDLINYLLKNVRSYKNLLEYVFSKLKDESSISIQFIEGFQQRTEKKKIFIQKLCENWTNIWGYYVNDINTSDDQLHYILTDILEYAKMSIIKKIADHSNLRNSLISDSNILNIISDHDKIKQIIIDLNLKFTDLNFENSPDALLDFIYNNNSYVINRAMVTEFIKKHGEFDQVSFDNSNYYSLNSSKASTLIQYINSDINSYVENLYLTIDTNVNEEHSSYLKLLNHEELNLEFKISVIEKVNTKISDLSLLKHNKLLPIAFQKNKIVPTWENLLLAYIISNEKILEEMIGFINDVSNSETLSRIRIPKEVDGENRFGKFTEELILQNGIDNVAYDLITKSVPWWYSNLEIDNLSEEKVRSLIKNTVIKPSIESFEKIKVNFDGLNIELLIRHKAAFLRLKNELELDGHDLSLMLRAESLNNLEKSQFLEICSNETIFSNSDNSKLIAKLLIDDPSFIVNEIVLRELLINKSVAINDRINLLTKNLIEAEFDFIEKFLKNLNGYERIINKGKKAKIADNLVNRALLNFLIDIKYISSYSSGLFGLRVNHRRR